MKGPAPPALARVLRACRSSLLWVGGFSLMINLLMLTPALYMLQVYDRVITTGSRETLLLLTLAVLFLFTVMGLLEGVRARVLVRVGNRLETRLDEGLHQTMVTRALRQAAPTAWPLDDLAALRQALAGGGLVALFDTLWVPLYLALLFLFHPWLGTFALLSGSVLLLLLLLAERLTRGLLQTAGAEQAMARGRAETSLRHAEVLHGMGMGPALGRRWRGDQRRWQAAQSRASDRAGLLSGLTRVLRLLLQSLILGLGALLVLDEQITPGMMIAASILMGRALAPVDQVASHWRDLVNARSAYHRLRRLLADGDPEGERMALPRPSGRLVAEAVTAAPPGSREPVLRGVSLSIAPGEQLGVIGPSASGKSTLVRVLLGIWPAQVGTVRLDGADIARWDREALGPHIGYLPQDIELFDGTIAENIARFGEVRSERVIAAARCAGLHETVLRLSDGYDTRLSATGSELSTGQRQRLGLARALHGDPVLVVLDEPNANLDLEGERALSRSLQRLRAEGVSLVVISHRTGVLHQVDTLLVLEDGRVVLHGHRERVLARLAAARQRAPASDAP
ncbi:type I secretion system permease/ATPase [Halomonas sp.]|uniref:type I secretion system permease/ATPase n=1 Tax=Halomonas sp. TaxID=1486246 RepID=UPI00298DD011|nr:type I secretion system permease/ATPase [Halomonas sp.]MDW7746764.1 type I secretion system permease/ATPase [Halomonas sp.]